VSFTFASFVPASASHHHHHRYPSGPESTLSQPSRPLRQHYLTSSDVSKPYYLDFVMAEASCSGSTPLKGLVDHQNRDGGLVRDRARASLTPANVSSSTQHLIPAVNSPLCRVFDHSKLHLPTRTDLVHFCRMRGCQAVKSLAVFIVRHHPILLLTSSSNPEPRY